MASNQTGELLKFEVQQRKEQTASLKEELTAVEKAKRESEAR